MLGYKYGIMDSLGCNQGISTGNPVLMNPGYGKKYWEIRWEEAKPQRITQTLLPLCTSTGN
jgi:hypothetical protein